MFNFLYNSIYTIASGMSIRIASTLLFFFANKPLFANKIYLIKKIDLVIV